MPFLLGMFGQCVQSSQRNRLVAIVSQYAQSETIQNAFFDKGVVYAGYKHDETCPSDTIMPLADDQGIFVGKMFDSRTFEPAEFSVLDSQTVVNHSKIIMKEWWGRYVGVFYNKTKQRCTLVRDPQGLSTLFYIAVPGGIIFSTDVALLYDFLEEKPALNSTYFAQYIIGNSYSTSLTPFKGIVELLPGMGLHIQPDGTSVYEQLWDISECGGSFITDTDTFEKQLLTTMRSCIKAWVGNSPGICLELSGGADSSGLMILLRDVLPEHKNIIGVNYIDSKTPSSNEIEHAQEVADMCGAPLHFIDWQKSALLDPLPAAWRPDKPTTFLLFNSTSQQLHEFAQQHGCSEVMNGQGGDHVFLAPQPIDSLADYWLDRGIRGIARPLQSLSSANRMPWWMLARDTASSVAKHYTGRESIVKTETAYFDQAFRYDAAVDEFYLKESVKKFYPAKKNHIKSLFHGSFYADRNQRMVERTITHPLLSQPIVEMGLHIPAYQSFDTSFDRIFFRNTVSRIKKPQALWRTIKGETTSSMAKSFAVHAGEVQDMIMQGYFARNGILNKQWFVQEMAKVRHGQIENLWPIIRFLTSQRWLNQWKM